MVGAIVLGGVAIVYISIAGGEAVYGQSFLESASSAYLTLFLAGGLFVVALVSLVAAAIVSHLTRKSSRDSEKSVWRT